MRNEQGGYDIDKREEIIIKMNGIESGGWKGKQCEIMIQE